MHGQSQPTSYICFQIAAILHCWIQGQDSNQRPDYHWCSTSGVFHRDAGHLVVLTGIYNLTMVAKTGERAIIWNWYNDEE